MCSFENDKSALSCVLIVATVASHFFAVQLGAQGQTIVEATGSIEGSKDWVLDTGHSFPDSFSGSYSELIELQPNWYENAVSSQTFGPGGAGAWSSNSTRIITSPSTGVYMFNNSDTRTNAILSSGHAVSGNASSSSSTTLTINYDASVRAILPSFESRNNWATGGAQSQASWNVTVGEDVFDGAFQASSSANSFIHDSKVMLLKEGARTATAMVSTSASSVATQSLGRGYVSTNLNIRCVTCEDVLRNSLSGSNAFGPTIGVTFNPAPYTIEEAAHICDVDAFNFRQRVVNVSASLRFWEIQNLHFADTDETFYTRGNEPGELVSTTINRNQIYLVNTASGKIVDIRTIDRDPGPVRNLVSASRNGKFGSPFLSRRSDTWKSHYRVGRSS